MPSLIMANGNSTADKMDANGYTASTQQANGDDTAAMKRAARKKLALIESEQQAFNHKRATRQNNINNNNKSEESVDVFSDTSCQAAAAAAHARLATAPTHSDEPIVFSAKQSNAATQMGGLMRDQMAAALLRLQAGLDATDTRLGELEKRVDSLATATQRAQAAASASSSAKAAASRNKSHASAILDTLGGPTGIAYLAWPVLVCLALRAYERRALAASITSSAAA